jgi:hypothetical protein
MGKGEDILALGIIGAGVFFTLTRTGKDLLQDVAGIDVDDFLPFDFELEDVVPFEDVVPQAQEVQQSKPTEYHFPIQDLYIPPNYYDTKYEIDPYRIPSDAFTDWYKKGSALHYQDYYIPPHYTWNPDYYYFNGNLQKRWYPNIYDISHKPTRRVPYWFGEVYY